MENALWGSSEVRGRAQLLTSLKRFQCLVLRLYWEMVDSHCFSSMKFPAFPATFPLFTSAWSETPTSTHRQAATLMMLLGRFGSGMFLLLLLLLLMLLLLLPPRSEWK